MKQGHCAGTDRLWNGLYFKTFLYILIHMKENIHILVNIYKWFTTTWERVVFLDFLSDLRKWIIDTSKIPEKNHLRPYIDEFTEDIKEWFQDITLKEFFSEMKDIISNDDIPQDMDSWICVINKDRQYFSKELKKELIILEKEELENIYDLRKILLQNFCKHGIIEIYEIKNEELKNLHKQYLDEISKENEKKRRTLLSIENIGDKYARAHLQRLQIDFWAERVQKIFEYYLNDIQMVNYLCKKDDVEELYSLITWKEQEKPYVEFFPNEGILKYKWKKSKPFKKGDRPHRMLSYIFTQDRDIGIEKQDIYFAMEETDSIDLFYKNRDTINTTKNAINRRFRDDFSTKEKFLVFEGSLLYRKK